jgi:hypothetical protein
MPLRPELPEAGNHLVVPLHLVGPPAGLTTRYGIDLAVGVNDESSPGHKKLWTTRSLTTRPRGSGPFAASRGRLFHRSLSG